MVKFTLFFVRLLKKPIQWWGVDYLQFETILRIKLTLDFRRNPNQLNSSSNKKQTFVKQLLTFVFLGGFMGFSLFSIHDILLNLTILYSMIMVMLATTLINEFTTVLFDERDNDILLARPLSNRTILLVRLMHIQFYMGYIALALSLISGIVLAFKHDVLVALAYFIGVGLSAWITLLFTIFFYLALSRFVKGEKFKDLITYVQIFLVIIIFGSYELLPRMIDTDAMKQVSMSIHWWTFLIPPAWLAGFVKLFTFTGNTTNTMLLAALAVVVPFAGAAVVVRFLSKGFANILSRGAAGESLQNKKKSWKEKFSDRMSRLFCVTETEHVGWQLTMKTTSRDRKFKQSVYPMLGIIPVFAFMMLKPDFNDLTGSLHQLAGSSRYLYFIFLGFFGSMSIMQLPYTDTPEASWIYKALPFNKKGHLLSGSVKAMLYKLFWPVYLLLIVFALLIWNLQIFPEMLLGGLLTMLMTLIMVIIDKMELPFTQSRDLMQQKGKMLLKMFLRMLLMGTIVGLVYGSSFLSDWLILLINVLVIGLIVLTNRSIRSQKVVMS